MARGDEPEARSIIDRVVEHFDTFADAYTFVIPQWAEDGGDLELVASRLTLQDRNRIKRVMDERGLFSGYAEIAVMKLRHKSDGAPAFTIADKPRLMRRADARILQEIGDKLLYDPAWIESAEKN